MSPAKASDRFVCEECGNWIETLDVERRFHGSKGEVWLPSPTPLCNCGFAMRRMSREKHIATFSPNTVAA